MNTTNIEDNKSEIYEVKKTTDKLECDSCVNIHGGNKEVGENGNKDKKQYLTIKPVVLIANEVKEDYNTPETYNQSIKIQDAEDG